MDVDEGRPVDDALAEHAPDKPEERRHAWFLALGVLRRRATVDAALRSHLRTPIGMLDAPVRAALRVGTFDKLFSRTPHHASVSQAVEVVRAVGAPKAGGLVNAVLRKVCPPQKQQWQEALEHPLWLLDRWRKRYGRERTEKWANANNEPPPLCAVLSSRANEAAWCSAMVLRDLTVTPATLDGQTVERVVRLDGHAGPVDHLPGYVEGHFWIQDVASVAVADLVPAGGTVLDACAAPGGKTARMIDRGSVVTAVDSRQDRLQRLGENMTRLGFEPTVAQWDWETGANPALGHFDAVLVDAPCTGLGTLRRHPDIRWRRLEVDLMAASQKQGRILGHASAHVAPGGALVYAVCSTEPEEGEEVVRSFLVSNDMFRPDKELCTAPPTSDEDGFYAMRMVRT